MTTLQVATSRPGPKPKPGERYPSGKLKPQSAQAEGDRFGPTPAIVSRMLALVAAKAADPALEGVLGWLAIRGDLTSTQTAAGMAYAQLRGEYDAICGFPRRSAASPNYEAGRGRGETLGASEKATRKVRDRFNDLIGDCGGSSQIRDLLDRVCVLGMRPENGDLKKLSNALDCIAHSLQLTRRRR